MTDIGILSTFPPTRCGLATFAADLSEAISLTSGRMVQRIPVVRGLGHNDEAELGLERDDPVAYRRLAELIRQSDCGRLLIQHEYGIYGGEQGKYIVSLLEALQCPAVTILHTTLPRPVERSICSVTRAVAAHSAFLVVMCDSAKTILARDYGIDPSPDHFLEEPDHC